MGGKLGCDEPKDHLRQRLVPLTQADMNIAAGKDLGAAEDEMGRRLLSQVEARIREADSRLFDVKLPILDSSTWLVARRHNVRQTT